MEKRSQKSLTSKDLRIAEGEKIVIGIDTHKETNKVALYSSERKCIVKSWGQSSEPEACVSVFKGIKDHIEAIYYEAGPTGFGLARALEKSGFCVHVVAPSKTPTQRGGEEDKSDRLDAENLAERRFDPDGRIPDIGNLHGRRHLAQSRPRWNRSFAASTAPA